MKVSIIISVYQSYEAVRRQLRHFSKIDLPFEVIIVDDGSTPPVEGAKYFTNNKLAWTQGLGRNLGASKATSEYLLMTDIDHIITKEAIEDVLNFNGPMMRFPRHFGILSEDGDLLTDRDSLLEYGMNPEYRELTAGVHMNTFAIKKDLFDLLGGYREAWCSYGYHPKTKGGDDCYFDTTWKKYARDNRLEQVLGSTIYVFPNGRFHKDEDKNPFGMFHNLSHEEVKFYKE